MNLEKTKTPRIIVSVAALIASLTGLVLIGLLNIANDNGTLVTFAAQINRLIEFFKGIGQSGNPSAYLGQFFFTLIVIILYLVTYISGLVFAIKLIVDIANINKEGYEKRITNDSLRMSYVLIAFFTLFVTFLYTKDATSGLVPEIGAYLGLGLGGLTAILSGVNFYLSSEKPTVNKILRICLMASGLVASVFVLMPVVVIDGVTTTPGHSFLGMLGQIMTGNFSGLNEMLLVITLSLFVVLLLSSTFAYTVGRDSISVKLGKKDEEDKEPSSVLLIVLAIIAVLFASGAAFAVPFMASLIPSVSLTTHVYAYIGFAFAALTFVLAVVVVALKKNEKDEQKEETNEEAQPEEEEKVEEEPTEEPIEEPVEEDKQEEAKEAEEAEAKEEVATAAIIADVATEEPTEEVKEETPVEEKSEEPTEEAQPVEEKPVKEKKTPKKAAPKKTEEKKAPAKKPAAKKEEASKEAKKNASYHISKRASDNKWQVFRAGSDKVIKLFDTKVEAEEYTKRMAENQGVSYLSHASKGKNKGKIQKK